MYWPGSWRIGEPAQGHVAGSISARFFLFFFIFFSLKKLSQLRGAEPATSRWASYVALSQLRGTEPATWHWASKVALSFELARRQWASKVALSFIIYIYIYIPMQSQPYNILNLGQNIFFEGDTYLWAGAGVWNLPFDQDEYSPSTKYRGDVKHLYIPQVIREWSALREKSEPHHCLKLPHNPAAHWYPGTRHLAFVRIWKAMSSQKTLQPQLTQIHQIRSSLRLDLARTGSKELKECRDGETSSSHVLATDRVAWYFWKIVAWLKPSHSSRTLLIRSIKHTATLKVLDICW